MPQRISTPVVSVTTVEVQGAGSWAKFRRRLVTGKERTALREDLERRGITFDASGKPHGGQFTPTELEAQGLRTLAESLVEWNWVDDNGEPLPQPNPDDVDGTVEMIRQSLNDMEIQFLSKKLTELLQNPGNSTRSARS